MLYYLVIWKSQGTFIFTNIHIYVYIHRYIHIYSVQVCTVYKYTYTYFIIFEDLAAGVEVGSFLKFLKIVD